MDDEDVHEIWGDLGCDWGTGCVWVLREGVVEVHKL